MVRLLSSWWSWILVCSLNLRFQILSHLISLNFGRRTWLFLFWLLTHVLNWLQACHSYGWYNTLLASFCWKRDRCALMQTVYASLVEQCMHVWCNYVYKSGRTCILAPLSSNLPPHRGCPRHVFFLDACDVPFFFSLTCLWASREIYSRNYFQRIYSKNSFFYSWIGTKNPVLQRLAS